MPRARDHEAPAVIVAVLLILLILSRREGPGGLTIGIGAIAGGRFGGNLPDILEPATSSWHWCFFHSQLVMAGGSAALISPPAPFVGIIDSIEQHAAQLRQHRMTEAPDDFRLLVEEQLCYLGIGFIYGTLSGYVSHLALDSKLPRGLPII